MKIFKKVVTGVAFFALFFLVSYPVGWVFEFFVNMVSAPERNNHGIVFVIVIAFATLGVSFWVTLVIWRSLVVWQLITKNVTGPVSVKAGASKVGDEHSEVGISSDNGIDKGPQTDAESSDESDFIGQQELYDWLVVRATKTAAAEQANLSREADLHRSVTSMLRQENSIPKSKNAQPEAINQATMAGEASFELTALNSKTRFEQYQELVGKYRQKFGHGPPCSLGDTLSPVESMPLMRAALEKGEPVPGWGSHREEEDVIRGSNERRSWAAYDRELPPGDPVFKRGFGTG